MSLLGWESIGLAVGVATLAVALLFQLPRSRARCLREARRAALRTAKGRLRLSSSSTLRPLSQSISSLDRILDDGADSFQAMNDALKSQLEARGVSTAASADAAEIFLVELRHELLHRNLQPRWQVPVTSGWRPAAGGITAEQLDLLRTLAPSAASRVGRDEVIRVVRETVVAGESACVWGGPGIGKTTVAVAACLELATHHTDAFTDVVSHRFVETGTCDERRTRLVQSLVLTVDPAADIQVSDPEVLFERARHLVAARRVLYLIDNADQHESMQAVLRLRKMLPTVVVLVTSQREDWTGLRLIRLAGMQRLEAVELFDKYSGIQGSDPTVDEICAAVEGNPLEILHMAVRSREASGGLEEIHEMLSNEGPGAALRDHLDRTVDAMGSGATEALVPLGLAANGYVRVEMALSVMGATNEALSELLHRHVIELTADGERYTAHAWLRSWCRSLAEQRMPEQRGEMLSAAAGYYAAFVEKRSNFNVATLRELDDEWSNISALILNPAVDVAARARLALAAIGDHLDDPNGYAIRRGVWTDLVQLGSLAAQTDREDDAALAALEKNLGMFAYWQADYPSAETYFLAARERYNRVGDEIGEATISWLLGYLADDESHYLEAERLYRDGTARVASSGTQDLEAFATGRHLIGCTLYHQGRFEEALDEFNHAAVFARQAKAERLLPRINRRLGYVHIASGRLDEGIAILRDVESQSVAYGRVRDLARVSQHLGHAFMKAGDLELAESYVRRAREMFEQFNGRRGIGATLRLEAGIKRMRGEIAEAEELCRRSIEIARDVGSPYGQAIALEELAACAAARSAPDTEVARILQDTHNIYRVIGHLRAGILAEQLEALGGYRVEWPEPAGVLIDVMDTLAGLKPGAYDAVKRELAAALGVSRERLSAAWTHSRELASSGALPTTIDRIRWVAKSLDYQGDDSTLSLLADVETDLWDAGVARYPDVIDALTILRSLGLKIALVCNGSAALRGIDGRLGIDGLVDVCLVSCEVGAVKPDPAIYEVALDRLGLTAANCIYVGDGNDHELDGARRLGMFAVKVTRGANGEYTDPRTQSLGWDDEVPTVGHLANRLRVRVAHA